MSEQPGDTPLPFLLLFAEAIDEADLCAGSTRTTKLDPETTDDE